MTVLASDLLAADRRVAFRREASLARLARFVNRCCRRVVGW